jgi:hypothetical protein
MTAAAHKDNHRYYRCYNKHYNEHKQECRFSFLRKQATKAKITLN